MRGHPEPHHCCLLLQLIRQGLSKGELGTHGLGEEKEGGLGEEKEVEVASEGIVTGVSWRPWVREEGGKVEESVEQASPIHAR